MTAHFKDYRPLGSRNYEPKSHIRTMSSNQYTNRVGTPDKDIYKSKRNLRSPRLNGDSIV